MHQKLPLDGFGWVEETCQFNQDFIKGHNEDTDIGYFIEADVQYLENLHKLHNDLLLLSERMKIGKVEKLIANLYHKEYVIHIRNPKQALNYGLILKRKQKIIKFN